MLVFDFDAELAATSADDFIVKLLIERLGFSAVVTGEDFTFGKARGGNIDVLRAIAEGRGPSKYLIALGYAGWGAGQLDAEMLRHGWHVVDGDDDLEDQLREKTTAARQRRHININDGDSTMMTTTTTMMIKDDNAQELASNGQKC